MAAFWNCIGRLGMTKFKHPDVDQAAVADRGHDGDKDSRL